MDWKIAATPSGTSSPRRQALQIHDEVVQGLVVAKMALDLDQTEQSKEVLASTLTSASRTPSEDLIRVLIADDAADIRLLVGIALGLAGDFEVGGEAADGEARFGSDPDDALLPIEALLAAPSEP